MSSGKCKLKSQWDASIPHLSECPKSRTLTTPNAEKEAEQQEISLTAWGMQNGMATREFGGFSYK
jgi:hypothetical protein